MIDPVVEAVCAKWRDRAKAGLIKYNQPLTRTDLTRADWLKHHQEELMDAVNYVQRLLMMEEESTEAEKREAADPLSWKVVITGNPVGGFEVYGPFTSIDTATAYGKERLSAGEEWWIMPLYNPNKQ